MVCLGLTALIINVLITYTSGTNTTLNKTLTFDNQCNTKPLCKNLLEQFNLLTNELISTKQYFSEKSTNSLSVRGKESSLKIREQCKVSRDKNMFDLRNEVNNALAKLTNKPSEEVTCEVDLVTDNSISCTELMDFMFCGVRLLNQGLLKANGSENYKEYQKWRTAYDELFKEYEKSIDKMKQNLAQESKSQMDILKQKVQSLQLNLTAPEKTLKDTTIHLIASELASEKIDSALQEFAKLRLDSTDVPEIVSTTYYNYTKKNNFMIIAKFISRLNNLTQKETGFRKLLEVLESKRDTHSYSVIYINYHVTVMLKYNLGRSTFQNLVSTKKKLQPYVNGVIDVWANEMRTNKENGTMIDVSNIYHDTFLFIYHMYAHQLVEKAFLKDMRNVLNIVRFTRKLRTFTLKVLTVSELLNLIQKHGHLDNSIELFMVARYVKDLLHDLTNQYPRDVLISELEKMKMKIPQQIRDLTWHAQSCTVKNVHTSEYLYSPEKNFNYPHTNLRYAFTWVRKNKMNDKFRWQFIADHDDDFQIKNVKFQEYLFGSPGHNVVLTHMSGTNVLHNSNWDLIPYKGHFLIKCNMNGKYMEPAGFPTVRDYDARNFMSGRRNIYLPNNKSIVDRLSSPAFSYNYPPLNVYLWDISCPP